MSEPTIQLHIVLGRRDEIVHGPEGADLVITVNRADVDLEPTVAYMQGRLKAAGDTGLLFEALRSGAVARELATHSASL
jgi:hypothetical protein